MVKISKKLQQIFLEKVVFSVPRDIKYHVVKGKTYGKTTCIPNIKKAYIDFEQFKETAVDVSGRRGQHNLLKECS